MVDLEACLQLSADAEPGAARASRPRFAARPHARAARPRRGPGGVRATGAALVAALETDLAAPEAAALAALADEVPGLTGFGWWPGRRGRARTPALRGEPWIEATVQGIRLRAHVRSFFQANRFLLDDLVAAVRGTTPPGGAVLDLYAGVGLFALPLAGAARTRVRGVEIDARRGRPTRAHNVERAGLANVRIEQGDVRGGAARRGRGDRTSAIVLDPPRAGAGAEVVRAVAARRPAGRRLRLLRPADPRPRPGASSPPRATRPTRIAGSTCSPTPSISRPSSACPARWSPALVTVARN